MAEDQIGGELAAHLLRDGHIGKIAEAGCDPIGHPVLPHDLLRKVPGTADRRHSLLGEPDRGSVTGNRDKVLQRKVVTVQRNLGNGFCLVHKPVPLF